MDQAQVISDLQEQLRVANEQMLQALVDVSELNRQLGEEQELLHKLNTGELNPPRILEEIAARKAAEEKLAQYRVSELNRQLEEELLYEPIVGSHRCKIVTEREKEWAEELWWRCATFEVRDSWQVGFIYNMVRRPIGELITLKQRLKLKQLYRLYVTKTALQD